MVIIGRQKDQAPAHCHRQCRNLAVVIAFLAVAGIVSLYFAIIWHLVSSSTPQTNPHLRKEPTSSDNNDVEVTLNPDVSYDVHAFYYPWYCSPETDGKYMHWNHPYLPHWNREIAKQYPTGRHSPETGDIGSSFYPLLGTYSSADPSIIHKHMHMLVQAGIGVIVVSWLPPHQHDDNGPPIAERLGPILDIGLGYGIQTAIHMEPYEGRSANSFRQDVQTLLQRHGSHPALYKLKRNNEGISRPVLYVYDQYRIPSREWKTVLHKNFPAIVLALLVEQSHWNDYVVKANFDGGYTYFASDTFTYGSKPDHWKQMQTLAAASGNKWFVPSVGPGYDDGQVRPWNSVNTKARMAGEYYDREWRAAIDAGVSLISITSFNEWHEGTQIEPAVRVDKSIIASVTGKRRYYQDYQTNDGGGGPNLYLERTKDWIKQWTKQKQKIVAI